MLKVHIEHSITFLQPTVCAKYRYTYMGVGLMPLAGKEMLCQGSRNPQHLTDNLYLVEGMHPLL